MKDQEFYQSPEYWPQPPDERPTLEQEKQPPVESQRAKPASNRKKRRKLTDSLGSLFVGAVAVVMVVSAVDAKDGSGYFDNVGGYGGSEICEICGEDGCPYWGENFAGSDIPYVEGLRIEIQSSIKSSIFDDRYAMPYRSSDDSWNFDQSYCIYTQDSRRVFLTLDSNKLPDGFYPNRLDHSLHSADSAYPVSEDAYVGISWSQFNHFAGESGDELLVQLLYSPKGVVPEIGFGLEEGKSYPYSFTEQVPELKHIWIRAYSNFSQEICDKVMEYSTIDTVDGDNLSYPLGNTMIFQETDEVRRVWKDEFESCIIEYPQIHLDGNEKELFFESGFSRKCYTIRSKGHEARLVISQVEWPTIFDEWDRLNTQASSKGHIPYFGHTQLQNYTHNSVEYEVHVVYILEGTDRFYTGILLLPTQETNIAVCFEGISVEKDRITQQADLTDLLLDSESYSDRIMTLLDQLSIQ